MPISSSSQESEHISKVIAKYVPVLHYVHTVLLVQL